MGVLCGSLLPTAHAQAPPDTLYPIIRTFTPGDYDGSGQLWSVTQDSTGRLYIGGQRYLRQFDGVRWRRFNTTSLAQARHLAVGPSNAVYIGTTDGVERLRADSTSTFRIERLADAVPDSLTSDRRPFGLAPTPSGVFVHTGSLLWRVQEDSLHRFAASLRARTLHTLRNRLVVQRASDGALVHVSETGAVTPWASDPRLRQDDVAAVLPGPTAATAFVVLDAGGMALASRNGRLRPVPTAADALLRRSTITDAVRLSDGTLALATSTHGILVVHPETGRVRPINDASGLPSNDVLALHVSPRNALWAATASGLARINWPSPWTRILDGGDPPPVLLTAMRTADGLYIGTPDGLLRWTGRTLVRVRGIAPATTVFDAVRIGDAALVSTESGLYAVQGTQARRISTWRAYGLLRSRQHDDIVYVGLLDNGVGRLRLRDGRWQEDGQVREADGRGYRVAQDTSGHLWMGTGAAGVFRVTWPPDVPAADATVAHFDTTDGLYSANFNFAAQIGPDVRFITHDGLYAFDPATERFGPDPDFAAVYADSILTGWPVEAPSAHEVWMDFGGYKFGVAKQHPDGTYRWMAQRFRRLADYGDVRGIYPDGDSLVWVGTDNGLLRYDRRRPAPMTRPFRTLVRRVTVNPNAPGARSRSVYGGDRPLAASLRLPYDDNTLRFAFGATSYEQVTGALYEREGPLEFRYRLDGYDAAWSAWSAEVQKDYTGLPEGTYTFRVQARNLANVVGETATLRLRIAPPWYRTGWAYALYALGAVGLVAGLVSLRTRQLRIRQHELEATVRQRTAEVRAQNEQLATQKDQLAHQADELRALDEAKSRFFANLSHEFRTPLTLILGPVRRVREMLQRQPDADPRAADAAEHLSVVERNTYRLLRMVRQLLDLARHDAGTLRLRAQPTAVPTALDDIVRAFVPLAERQRLALSVEAEAPPADAPPVYLDSELFKQIVGNLVSNAIKFTPAGGRVTVSTDERVDAVAIAVADTGVGIPESMQERIFERFAQADDAATRAQEGAGIGLALTRTLVDLHGGTLTVESTEGTGATFTATFPRGRAHLADDQVVALPKEAAPPPQADAPEIASGNPTPRRTSPRRTDSGDDLPGDAVPNARPPDADTSANTPPDPVDTPLVLVVDDNPDVRTYVRSILRPSFRVVEAATGVAGIQKAQQHLPDVILADVMMPEMDGLAMTERLRADPQTEAIPVVMLTARAGTEDEIEGLAVGATDYVIKPFDPQVLEMRVRGTLAYQERLRRKLLAELRPAQPAGAMAFEDEVRAAIAQRLPNPDLGPHGLAETLGISRSTLYRRLNDAGLPSPAQLIQDARLQRARQLLGDSAGTVSEVAYAVGFRSLSHFSNRFTDRFQTSPSDYAAQHADA